ncbi:MAB_1171c family putative transporter [Streptacidiphilus sp. N1-3]|uniref:MAB_1171c family putative transporter n=1 Tax=Streptacidiphilus alkalitolerans TaxID=3342712 RepID=A0ABV6XAZ6_9ACTN
MLAGGALGAPGHLQQGISAWPRGWNARSNIDRTSDVALYSSVPGAYVTWAHIFDIVYPLCAASSLVAAASKAGAWWRDRSASLLTLVGIRVVTSIAFLCGTPWLQDHLARAVGFPNIATLILYPCIVLQSLASLLVLWFWQKPAREAWRGARWLVVTYGLILCSMVLLFMVGHARDNRPIDFDVYYARNPAIAAFQLLYDGCFAVGLLANIRMTRRYSVLVREGMPWVRRGLNVTALGCTVALGHFLTKVPSMVCLWFGSDTLNFANIVVGPIFSAAAALLIHAGATVPAWGSRLEAWLGLYRSYRDIQPLMRAVQAAVPDIALESPSLTVWSKLRAVIDLRHSLYRAVIEIRDAQRELRPYLDPAVASAARALAVEQDLDVGQVETVVDAAVLGAAIKARTLNSPSRSHGSVTLSVGADDLAEEIAVLAAIGRAYSHSPTVAQTLDWAAGLTSGTPVAAAD